MQYWIENLLAWFVTYAMHSTLLLGGAWLFMAWCTRLGAEYRELVWKWALVGSVATATLQATLPLPRWLEDLPLSPATSNGEHVSQVAGNQVALPPATAAERRMPAARVAEQVPVVVQPNVAASSRAERMSSARPSTLSLFVGAWLAASGFFLVRLAVRLWRLRQISGTVCREPAILEAVSRLARKLGISAAVQVIETAAGVGPMASGLFRFRVYCPAAWLKSLGEPEREALLAHELAHLARRDAWWNLAAEVCCALFFFQPLNLVARRKVREQAEFLADQRAAELLSGGLGLARCLVLLAESPQYARHGWHTSVAVGMAAYRSQLGRRVELLCESGRRNVSPRARRFAVAALFGILLLIPLLAPGASARPREPNPGDPIMRSSSWKLTALLTAALGVAAQAPAQEEKPDKKPAAEITQAAKDETPAADKLPEGARGFDGQVVGLIRAKKDAGVLFEVTKVVRVWENSNKAKEPESLAGKKILIRASRGENGQPAPFQVRYLAKVAVNDDARLNIKQVEDGFVITELSAEQRELAGASDGPAKEPAKNDQPAREPAKPLSAEERAKFPEGARGLSGRLVGRLVKKDAEKGELTLENVKVDRVWPGSKASAPKGLDGRTVRIEKVFGRFLDVLLTLKEGDGVQIEVKHLSGDGLVFLGEELKKIVLDDQPRDKPKDEQPKPKEKDEPKKPAEPRGNDTADAADAPPGMAGFRGLLVGELVSADAEKGSFVVKLERVKRTWAQNKAPAPEKSVGKNVSVEGVFGKFLDVLITLKPGDKVEFEAFHVRGQALKFPGEWLKKAEAEGAK